MVFVVPAKHSENERKRKDKQILGSCQRSEKSGEYEGDKDINDIWRARNSSQRREKETEGTRNQKIKIIEITDDRTL